jgi:hypothetical protein
MRNSDKGREACIPARVSDDRADDGNQFTGFCTQRHDLISRPDVTVFNYTQTHVTLPALLQRDATPRDEISLTLCRPGFFQHRGNCCRAVDQLRDEHPSHTAAVVKRPAGADDRASKRKGPLSNILTILILRKLSHAWHPRTAGAIVEPGKSFGFGQARDYVKAETGTHSQFPIPNS